jgi:photosystem II stability/assembly factor-like uncharacterized protein
VLLCTGSNQICRSTDQGNNWASVFTTSGSAIRVAFAPSDANTCYVVTNEGRVYKNTHGGTAGNWSEPYTAANKPPNGTISSIAVGWNNSDLVFITYSTYGVPHVYRSIDGGAHWSAANGTVAGQTFPEIPANALVIDQYNPDTVYVASDIGVFRTRDAGASWDEFSFNLPRIVVTELVLRKVSNSLYASTMGRGAYRYFL